MKKGKGEMIKQKKKKVDRTNQAIHAVFSPEANSARQQREPNAYYHIRNPSLRRKIMNTNGAIGLFAPGE